LKIESGGFRNIVHWGAEVVEQSDGASRVKVTRQEPLDAEPNKVWEGTLNKKNTRKFWNEARKVTLCALPRTDYISTMSDDCYHLGITVDFKHTDVGMYTHQIPIGPCVIVSSTCPTKQEMLRFLNFVSAVTLLFEKISAIKIPDYVRLRWESRKKELNSLDSLG